MARSKRTQIAAIAAQNEVTEMRLKEKVRNRILGVETNGMRVKNLLVEEIVDTILDANEVILLVLEEELKALRESISGLAEETKKQNVELLRTVLLQVLGGLGQAGELYAKPPHSDEPDSRTMVEDKKKTTQRPEHVLREKKGKIFSAFNALEAERGELRQWRSACEAMPRLTYYLYGKYRIWEGWEDFLGEYIDWASGFSEIVG